MVLVQGDVPAYLHPTDPTKRSSNVYTCPGCNVNHEPLVFRCKTKNCKGEITPEKTFQNSLRELEECINKCVDVKLQISKKEMVDDIMRKILRTL
jgi:hypothetical protein